MIDQDLIEVLIKALREAVEESKEVRIESKPEGYILSSYQDKIGVGQLIGWHYGKHCDGRLGYVAVSIKEKKDASNSGYLYIDLTALKELEISVRPAMLNTWTYISINRTLKISIKNDTNTSKHS